MRGAGATGSPVKNALRAAVAIPLPQFEGDVRLAWDVLRREARRLLAPSSRGGSCGAEPRQ